MMKKQIAATVLAVSVAGGIGAGVAVDALTPDRPVAGRALAELVAVPVEVPDFEVIEPVLVMNDDGSATLSATVVNHTKKALEINSATSGQADDLDAPPLLVYGSRLHTAIEPGRPLSIGGVDDAYRIRLRDQVRVGATLPITVRLTRHQGYDPDLPEVTVLAPVVARTATYADVANNGPNSDITVRDAVIVVVPGQAKAYVGGTMESTIDDMTELRPVIEPRLGRSVEILHQTATGGPSGFVAQIGTTTLGQSPYLDDGLPGDRDYVRASDVTVGQTVTATIRFPSGDVVVTFKVVQGTSDGTI